MTFINPRVVLECQHIDTCLSDYWGGHHLPHLQIPVHRNMKLHEIKAALLDELLTGAVAGSEDDARILSGYDLTEGEQARHDNLYKAAKAAINRIKPATKGQRTFFKDLEPETEDSETVYAFFVLVDITPERMKRVYWLCLGNDDIEESKPYLTKQECLNAYWSEASELADLGQELAATVRIGESLEDLAEYPDFVLTLGPRGAVAVLNA